jgi:hypothetical protein
MSAELEKLAVEFSKRAQKDFAAYYQQLDKDIQKIEDAKRVGYKPHDLPNLPLWVTREKFRRKGGGIEKFEAIIVIPITPSITEPAYLLQSNGQIRSMVYEGNNHYRISEPLVGFPYLEAARKVARRLEDRGYQLKKPPPKN